MQRDPGSRPAPTGVDHVQATAVVIDTDPDVRGLVGAALEHREVVVVAEGTSGQDAVALAAEWQPTVLVLEHPTEGAHHLDTIGPIRRAAPTTCIVLHAAVGVDLSTSPPAARPAAVVPKFSGLSALLAAIEDCVQSRRGG